MNKLARPAALMFVALASAAMAEDAVLLERHARTPAEPIANVDWFEPTVPVGRGVGAPLTVAADSERSMDNAALEQARRYATEKNSYALLIAHRGVLQLEHYALGFHAERRLDSQSMHKPLAAILTMAAVADGKLKLDDPIGRFIPAWRRDARGRITVRDVLYMQTGLAEPAYQNDLASPGYRMFITSQLRNAVLAMPLEDSPGSRYKSHFAATQLLQLILESATGQRYATYLDQRLWSRLGAGEARVRLDRANGDAQVFCCIQAYPRDWLRVGLMLVRHGALGADAVLPLDAWQQLVTPSVHNPNFGMQQIWLGSPYKPIRAMDSRNPTRGLPMSAPFAADDVFYLEGRGGQRVYVVPSRELVVVRQGEVRMEWDDAAFLNPLILAVPPRPRAGLPAPTLAYSVLLTPHAPDYAAPTSWSRHPTKPSQATAAFYVHPTTYRGDRYWNAPHDDAEINPGVDEVVVGQASVLDACCDVYVPRYRQAAIAALGSNPQPYDLAFQDVRRAFRQFVSEIGSRPFVLLGHSQGALHVQRLLTDVVEPDPALAKRLVAAYVVGIPVPEALYSKRLQRVRPCRTATQTHCVASWSTYSERFATLAQMRAGVRAREAQLMQAANNQAIQCTNPLSGVADELPVPASENRGARIIDRASLQLSPPVPQLVGARCEDGALIVSPEPAPPFNSFDLMGGNYHLADIALFHRNVADNIRARAAEWHRRRGKP